jgi:hypothetical protein
MGMHDHHLLPKVAIASVAGYAKANYLNYGQDEMAMAAISAATTVAVNMLSDHINLGRPITKSLVAGLIHMMMERFILSPTDDEYLRHYLENVLIHYVVDKGGDILLGAKSSHTFASRGQPIGNDCSSIVDAYC